MTADEIQQCRRHLEACLATKCSPYVGPDTLAALLDAAEEARSLRAENERLRAALVEIKSAARSLELSHAESNDAVDRLARAALAALPPKEPAR